MSDSETQEDAHHVECLDMEALPSGSNQVKTTTIQTKYAKTWDVVEQIQISCSKVIVEANVLQGEDEDKESVVSLF